MKEAVLYQKKGERVQCLACARKCLIAENHAGVCGTRKNVRGKLYSLVYGKAVAVHVDPIEKKPLYHFLPGTKAFSIGTIGCNFKCDFCQNWDISQATEIIGETLPPKKIIELAIKNKCETIAYTYNEPAIFIEYVKDTSLLAKKKGLKNILVTNGYLSKESLDFISNVCDAMNIDLKSFNDDFYIKNCKSRLAPVLETIKLAHKKGIWIELTTLIIPGENDSPKELEQIAKFIAKIDKNIPWHISRFFPMHKMQDKQATEIKKLEEAYEIGKKYLNYVYLGNIPNENPTLCPNPKCKKVLIERLYYSIRNHMNKEKPSKCPECRAKIPGVWE